MDTLRDVIARAVHAVRNGGWICPACDLPSLYGQGLIWQEGELRHQECLVVDTPERAAQTMPTNELRERLNRIGTGYEEWDQIVDAILAEIEAAGWKLAPPEDDSSLCVGGECWSHDGHEWAVWYDEALDKALEREVQP